MSHSACRRWWVLFVLLALCVAVLPQASITSAATGDVIHTTRIGSATWPRLCEDGVEAGIAFDNEFLWVSCDEPELVKANARTGEVLAAYDTTCGGGGLAWDGKRQKLWIGGYNNGLNGGDVCLFDPATGTDRVVFNSGLNAFNSWVMGLPIAYNAQDDTLYLSDRISATLYRYSAAGAKLPAISLPASCWPYSLAVGGALLFLSCDGYTSALKLTNFTEAFRLQTDAVDLECDDVTFRPRTVLWEFVPRVYGLARAREIPAGSCVAGGGVDSDGDGLTDTWERFGLTNDPDGMGPLAPQFVDLPAMGADVNKPDLFLQVDWMQDTAHSHKMNPQAIKNLVQAFAVAPYRSPTGSVGINLHIDSGADSILNFTSNTTWGSLSRARALAHVDNLGTTDANGVYIWTEFDSYKQTSFIPTGRAPVFRYVIAAHRYGGTQSAGISRGIGGSDIIVAFGLLSNGVGTPEEQATDLMHELGHNIGLRHGGGDDTNYKPNYLSVMNYHFSLQGLVKNGVSGYLDYSRVALPTLNETNLNEPIGLGSSGIQYDTRHYCVNLGRFQPTSSTGAIDWNCDNDITDQGIRYNINGDYNNSGAEIISTALSGHNDWARLLLKAGAVGQAGFNAELPLTSPVDLIVPEVAHLTGVFIFNGFFAPVDNPPILNEVKAGSTVPIKFNLSGDQRLAIFAASYPKSQVTECDEVAPVNGVEETASASANGLTYDAVSGQYTYPWKTDKAWTNSCRQLVIQFTDGSTHRANFRFK